MNLQAFQPGELRNDMDEIIRPGAYGKKTAFATADNNGILDYIMNNFEVLKDALSGAYIYAANLSKFPLTGSSDKLYVAEDTGQTYKWSGSAYVLLTSPINGKSAYEIACDNGFTGTAKEWLASIGAETFDSVSVDESGYLTFHLHSGGTLTAPMKPVIEASASASQAKAWAASGSSPDGATDSDSSTGKTQSSKSWALYSKDRATASASSASASASSASAAKSSQTAAANSASAASSSASAASTSATNAKNSQTAAASSASAAKSSQTAAATSETNAKTALVSCQNIQTQVNNGLQSLTSAVKYRGSVASFSALPASGQSVGDMYNIKAAGGTDANGTAIRAGDNVVWNGSGWDDQAGTVDLSNYYTKSEVNGSVVSATVSNATITFIHKGASKSTVTVNNVDHATKASQDDKGQTIDVAALKTLIMDTVNAMDFNMLKRNKAYSIGDIAYSSYLPSWGRLECVTAGTTADTVPDTLTTVSSGGVLISDGTVTWIVDDVRDMTPVGCVRGSLFLPKGYIKANGATVQRADYPRLVQFIESNNLWTDDTTNNAGLFGKGDGSSTFVLPDYRERMLQYTEENIGKKREAGLPNIKGESKSSFQIMQSNGSGLSGAFKGPYNLGGHFGSENADSGWGYGYDFDASRSSSIYGNSDTVQPPAINVIPILRY